MRRVAQSTLATAAAVRNAAFTGVPMGPPDPIFGLTAAFKADTFDKKVNLGAGVYRGDDGKPFVLPCVRKAELMLAQQGRDHEYAAIDGLGTFVGNARELAFGKSQVVADNRVVTAQSISGTGSLRVAAEFIARFSEVKAIAVPDPTWANHIPIFRDAGLEVKKYSYYDACTIAIKEQALLQDLNALPEGTAVLLHACAHNPTGIDPTPELWEQIADVVVKRRLLPLVDMAYQGFASGDVTRDAAALRLLAGKCPELLLCQSFAKSFGLYGERTGAVHIMSESADVAKKVSSQLKILIRPFYGNPPLYGARVVETILGDAALTDEWHGDLKQMADRMNGVRDKFVRQLQANGSQKDWSHITKQIGMFAYTGLSKNQVEEMKAKHHIYMTGDGRIAVSGLNSTNLEYVSSAFHAVTK